MKIMVIKLKFMDTSSKKNKVHTGKHHAIMCTSKVCVYVVALG